MKKPVSLWLRENTPLYDNREKLFLDCMAETESTRKIVQNAMYDISRSKHPVTLGIQNTSAIVSSIKPFRGLSESEIREKHDTKFIFSKAVKALERGLYIADSDFIKQCDIKNHVGYIQVLDDPEFKKYKGRAGGITYWSHPDSIEKMKNEGILT